MTNTGSEDVEGVFTLASDTAFATCGAGYKINPSTSYTCYGSYTITQDDLDLGYVENRTSAYTKGAGSNETITTVTASQAKRLTVGLIATSDAAGAIVINKAPAGVTIYYTYTLTNTGNVTLTSPVFTILDNKLGAVTCPSPATLAPLGVYRCSGVKTYTITATDVTNGKFENTATLTYTPNPITSTATATVYTSKIIIFASASPTTATAVNQVIAYSYSIYNNSGASVASPTIAITNPSFSPTFTVDCPTGSLADGASVTCAPPATTPATYTITQADMDAGTALTHTATATSGAISSPPVNVSVLVVQKPELTLAISGAIPTLSGDGITTASITFSYLVTNSGNVTLTPAINSTVRNDAAAILATCSPSGPIIPGAATTCTGSYAIIQADIDNNYVVNKATATATAASGPVSSTEQTITVPVYNGARLKLGITASKVGTEIRYAYTLTNTGNASITFPAPYTITYTITDKADLTNAPLSPIPSIFTCAPVAATIGINSSTPCATGSSFITTQATGILINTATAEAPPFTDPAVVITGSVEYDVNLYCKITQSGPIPENVSNNTSAWTIYNKTNPASTLHIKSITVFWESTGIALKEITLGGVPVWRGSTKTSGIVIDKGTGSAVTNPDWDDGLDFVPTQRDITLQFTSVTYNIQVRLDFFESDCSAGLTSGGNVQREPCTLPGSPVISTLSGSQTNGNVNLTWTPASSNATGYKIEKSTNNILFSPAPVASVGNVLFANNVDTIPVGTTQYYRIKPTNACGDGTSYSNTVTVTRPVNRTVTGTITETVSNITPSDITITGSAGGSCSKPTSSTYTCTMTEGSGTITVGAYSTNWSNGTQKTSRDNMVCLLNPVTIYGTPWGATAGTTGATDTTTFTFSALSANVTRDILISNQAAGTPSGGYTCYPGTIP